MAPLLNFNLFNASGSSSMICKFFFAVLTISLIGIDHTDASNIQYYRDIAPILSKNCTACHNSKTAEGGLNLESFRSLIVGGDSGSSFDKDNPDQSYLLWRVTGEEEPVMPPKDNSVGARQLTPKEIQLLRDWISAGLPVGEPVPNRSTNWSPLPETLKPIYSIEQSQDGEYLAFGYGQNVMVSQSNVLTSGDSETANLQLLIAPDQQLDQTHLDIVQSIAISPDSTRIATGGYRNVKIWHRDNDAQTLIEKDLKSASCTSISPSERWLAVGHRNGEITLVDLSRSPLTPVRKTTHRAQVNALVWLANSRLLSCDSLGNWSLSTGDGMQSSLLNPERLTARQLVAVGKRVFCLDANGHVRTLRLNPNALGQTLIVSRRVNRFSNVTQLAASRKGTKLVIGSSDGSVQVLDTSTFKVIQRLALGRFAMSFVIDAQAQKLATTSDPITIWNLNSGEKIANAEELDLPTQRRVHFVEREIIRLNARLAKNANKRSELNKASEKEVEALKKLDEARSKAAETFNKQRQALASSEAALKEAKQRLENLQNAETSKSEELAAAEKDLSAKQKAVETSRQNANKAKSDLDERKQALAAAEDSATRAKAAIVAAEQLRESIAQQLNQFQHELQGLSTPIADPIRSMAFTNDGSTLLVERGSPHLLAYSSETGKAQLGFSRSSQISEFLPGTRTMGITGQGDLVAWDLTTPWKLEHSVGTYAESPFSDRITALDFSPDGSKLAVGSGPPSRSGEIHLLNVRQGNVERDFDVFHSDTVLSLRFDPSGRILASASADKLVKTFEVNSGEHLQTFEGHTHHVLGLDWREDGEVLATAGADATVRIWNAETAQQLRTIAGFRKEVSDVHFVGSSHDVISSSADGSIRMVNADSGKQVRSFAGTKDAVFGLAISSQQQLLSAGGQAGQVWTWRLSDAKLLSALPRKN